MTLPRVVLSIALVSGCSDYNFGTKPSVATGSTETGTVPPTTTEDLDCGLPDDDGFDASVQEDCYTEVQTGTFTPVLEWEMQSFSTVGSEVMSTPIVVDVNLDGIPDVVFVSYYPGTVRAVSGDGSGELWSQDQAGVQFTGGVAAADLDGDGFVEIVSLRPQGVAILEHDGAIRRIVDNLAGHITGTSDVPAISDVNHDGQPEIIAGRALLDADGNLLSAGSLGMGGVNGANVGVCSFAVDLDLDGTEEIITGNAAYRPNGSTLWSNGLPDGYPAVGNFDGDPEGEVVVVSSSEIRVLDTDGSLMHQFTVPGSVVYLSSAYGGPPTVADFDGDGEAEIGVAAGSQYTVFETDGTVLWQAITDDSSSGNTGSAVFDFEGDGVAEVVYADQTRLWVFDGRTGAVKLASTDHTNGTWLEYPTIADVDADGHAEIVVANTLYTYPSRVGITVFGDQDDSWQAGRQIWNQHAYFITNVEDDGSVPVTAATNWATYNNFRSGDVTAGSGANLADLTLARAGLCDLDCEEGRLVLSIHAGNQGLADVTAAHRPTVELYAVEGGAETLVDTQPLADLLSGEFLPNVVFDVTTVDLAATDAFVVRVQSRLPQCNDNNDEYTWDGPFCE
jgi:hypothetical protein